MIDLLLGAALSTSSNHLDQLMQHQVVAQAATVYLPTSTTQSQRPQCVTLTATNASNSIVTDIYVNYTDKEGKPLRYSLSDNPANPQILRPGATVSFDLCQGQSLINVEAKQR